MTTGYYRFPTIHNDTIVFVCEDDLWTVPTGGGIARRLTSGLSEASYPFLSPDGSQIAFIGREEGHPELYVMPAEGGPARRLTSMGGSLVQAAGWTGDGRIVFANNAGQPFSALMFLYVIGTAGGPPERLNIGPAREIAFGPSGGRVIGRNTHDPARWKRYRGGTAGQIWIDRAGSGEFQPLVELKGNLINPMWIGERVYFLSDHEGNANLYSCRADGDDLRRHTDHQDFYARNASSDGRRIVYHAGAEMYVFDPADEATRPVDIQYFSPQVQRNRKFVDPERFLNEADLHPHGHALAVSARSLVCTFTNWEGPVYQHGDPAAGVRYRLPAWLNDSLHLLALSDEGGEETFVILAADGSQPSKKLPAMDTGRILDIAVHPGKDQVVFSNHRRELMFLDLQTNEPKLIDRSLFTPVTGFGWSPDGEWVVYSISISQQRSGLKLWKAATGETFPLTNPVLRDTNPVFEPHGKFILFLSHRTYDPVLDNMAFDLTFPRGVKPYLITLQKDVPSPFAPYPRFGEAPKEKDDKEPAKPDEKNAPNGLNASEDPAAVPASKPASPSTDKEGKPEEKKEPGEEKPEPIVIDLDGIQERILAFPTRESRFGRIMGTNDAKVFYSVYPIEGTLDDSGNHSEPAARGMLLSYDFEDHKEDVFINGISDFVVGRDGRTLLIRSGNRLRVIKTNFKPDSDDAPGRKSGWIDLSRLKVPVVPAAEWRQMFREIWRHQRDHFWTPDMSQVDWIGVYERYLPLVERVSSRSEFSDLVWELQGELGTSHAYELGGDYRPQPVYPQGSLGADYEFDESSGGWKITHIVRGDSWDERANSPLNRPGVEVKEGDILLAINGQRLSRNLSPGEVLINLSHADVTLTFAGADEANPHVVMLKTIGSEEPARYREWVESNRRHVHAATDGKVGYLHVPDMGSSGYAEFHRGYLEEVERPGIIVDVRFNRGGYVSQLLLEKLARRRLGYDLTRWSAEPEPFPRESVLGPMVALTNEFAGSDGDIFCHSFKLMGLGPLIGKRTWGGVIGYFEPKMLVDGSSTTQPEASFWFKDVGYGIENYGTDPDIEVDNTPQDYARGVDAQLERSIQEIKVLMEENPPNLPDLSQKPSRAAPKLPQRNNKQM